MADRDDDIDAAFRDLVASMGQVNADMDQVNAEGESSTSQDATGLAAELATFEEKLKNPDDQPLDESLHLEGGKLSVALVLAPLNAPEALHALLALKGISEAVVRLKPWTAVWLPVETTPTDEDELEALLADSRPMPSRVDEVARLISRLSKYGAVAMMSWLVEGDGVEPGVSGRITAQRYVSGAPEEAIPAGLLLGSMPQATEDLLLGRTKPEDYEDSVSANGTTRKHPGPFGWLRRR